MWRIPSERIALDLDGPSVEVERIASWHVQFEGFQLLGAFEAASKPADEYRLLNALYEHFMAEAQPQWDIVDHRGPVPLTSRGMGRLPLTLGRDIVLLWLNTLAQPEHQPEPTSAVDALVPPGPLNLEVKRRLRAAKRKAA